MNSRRFAPLRFIGGASRQAVPRALPTPIVGNPVQLTPIPWGKPDRDLGRLVCRHVVDVTPPIVIPCNPFTEAKTLRTLRSHAIFHH